MLSWSSEDALKLNVQIKAVEPTLEAGAQIQQMITAECIDDYAGKIDRNENNSVVSNRTLFDAQHFNLFPI